MTASERYGTGFPQDPLVKLADNVSLAMEIRDLFPADGEYRRRELPDPLPEALGPLAPAKAEAAWLARFRELTR